MAIDATVYARLMLAICIVGGFCGGCGGGGGSDAGSGAPANSAPPAQTSARLETVASGLDAPLFVTAAPGDATRLFVINKSGTMQIIDPPTKTVRETPFLDLRGVISSGPERGLLGLAFDPAYATNRRFYVFYTTTAGALVIARHERDPVDPQRAAPGAVELLRIAHPNPNHNGGMLAFGSDGCLYAGIGDGGGTGDPDNNAQNRASRFGKILRLDAQSGADCTAGAANPFAAGGGDALVWSYGLRNPWRFSFDRDSGDLYVGDVGQNAREEVSVARGANAGRGANFGWRLMEGTVCFNPASDCVIGGLTLPVLDYPIGGGACAVTGGYVYRGSALPALRGTYFYGDFCAGFVRSFRLVDGRAQEAASWPLLAPAGGQLVSFGEDAAGELYVVSLAGTVAKVVSAQ